jgi:predicted GNAT superfamily acetyltransferase
VTEGSPKRRAFSDSKGVPAQEGVGVLITYRQLRTADEMRACTPVQVATWQMEDLEEVVPVHQLVTAAKYGGLVIGAFDGDQLIGLSYGFIGLHGGRPLLCSHMLAVLPAYRGQGIGVRLKLEQRRLCLAQGVELMHWTYDPLEAVNGSLNVVRLGAIARIYAVNQYGEMQDGLNAGLPSDRLVVEWHLAGKRAAAAAVGEPVPGALPLAEAEPIHAADEPPAAVPPGVARRPRAVFIPRSFQQIKQEDPALALRWRLGMRHALQSLFAAGYVLTGCDGGAYILTPDEGLIL